MFEKREEMKMWESILQTKTYQRRMEDTLQELEIQAVTGQGGKGKVLERLHPTDRMEGSAER